MNIDKSQSDGRPNIPNDHPRAKSLHYRHLLVDGMYNKVVTPSGLIAHGRGEAFDYILGEKTNKTADHAIKAAVAKIILAEHPILSVNGNVAALVPNEIVEFSEIVGAKLEINIFYRAEGRIEAIAKVLKDAGAKEILGIGDVPPVELDNLSSDRRIVDPRGILIADVVLVPLEDGDRTEALVRKGKFVITIDLNPLSRTAQKAHITIVDNIVRAIPLMIKYAKEMINWDRNKLEQLVNSFNQDKNLEQTLDLIIEYLQKRKNRTKNT